MLLAFIDVYFQTVHKVSNYSISNTPKFVDHGPFVVSTCVL